MKEHRLISFIKNNYKYIIFILFLFFLNIYLFNKAFVINNIEKFNSKNCTLFIIFTLIELIYILMINIRCRNKYPLEKLFLILILPIGLMYMLFLPFGSVPDEITHFSRIYSISDGHIVSEASKDGNTYAQIPTNIISTFYVGHNKKYNYIKNNFLEMPSKEKINTVFTNTALYCFIIYIPQTIGVLIGKTINLPFILSMYLARLFNFITFVILMCFSIKLIPYLKKYLLLISLLPIVLQEAVSFSSDALTISISFFLISYVLYLKEKKDILSKKDYIIIIISTIICSMAKIVYIPIIFLIYLLPKELFVSKKDKYIKLSLIILTCIIINGAWTMYASRYLIEYNEGVNSTGQIKYILSNPLKYIFCILRTIGYNGTGFVYQAYGRNLGLLNIDVGRFYPICALFFSIYLSLTNRFKEKKNTLSEKIMYLLVPLGIICLIFTSLYIQWTPVSKEIVDGVQGRYFIPLLLFIPLILMRTNKSIDKFIINDNNILKYIIIFIIFENINAIAFIIVSNL